MNTEEIKKYQDKLAKIKEILAESKIIFNGTKEDNLTFYYENEKITEGHPKYKDMCFYYLTKLVLSKKRYQQMKNDDTAFVLLCRKCMHFKNQNFEKMSMEIRNQFCFHYHKIFDDVNIRKEYNLFNKLILGLVNNHHNQAIREAQQNNKPLIYAQSRHKDSD